MYFFVLKPIFLYILGVKKEVGIGQPLLLYGTCKL